MSEIKNTYYCPLCGTKTKDYFLVMGSSLIDSASDIKCSNKQCFFSSNYVPYRTWQHIADVKKNELNLQSENAALRSRISELEKQLAETCHIITTGCPTDRTEYCRANAPNESSQDCCKRCCIDAIKAYLPEPPREEGND